MARSISDIKTALGNAYIAQESTKIKYSITPDDVAKGFDSLFSKVSVESLLFYAFAFCVNAFEQIMDVFKADIKAAVDAGFVANKAWWHAQALKFQRGHNLVLNTTTYKYEYPITDTSTQIVKKVAVRETVQQDGACKVKLFLATETDGVISALTSDDKALFEIYANQIKPSGLLLQVISGNGDVVDFGLTVNYNPLLMNSSGQLLTDTTRPVEVAISEFIDALNSNSFGGKLNLTRLIDAVQTASGVVDAKLTQFKINTVLQSELWGTFDSTNGWFSLGAMTIAYQPQTEV